MTTPTAKPVPSDQPADLLFNAEAMDKAINSSGARFSDRLGVVRRTWAGLEADVDSLAESQRDDVHVAAQAQRTEIASAADTVLAQAGYSPPVAYGAGLLMSVRTQTVEYQGNAYAPVLSALPFTTSGAFEAAKFRLIQGVSSGDLGLPNGLAMSGFAQPGAGAVARNSLEKMREVELNIRDYGAAQGGGGNQASAFNAAFNDGPGHLNGMIRVPFGSWRATSEITAPNARGILGKSKTKSVLILGPDTGAPGAYGLNIAGAGLGASETNGFELGFLNIWGRKGTALVRPYGTNQYVFHDIVVQNHAGGNAFRFEQSQDGDFDRVDFVECGDPALSASAGASLYYGPFCNNNRHYAAHWEAPRNTCCYAESASNLLFNAGKADGGGASGVTTNPFFVADKSQIFFRDFLVTGFQNYPLQIRGWGQIDYEGQIVNGKAPAVFYSADAGYRRFLLDGGLPGAILRPRVRFRGTIGLASLNTADNTVAAVMALYAPDPLLKPNAGNDGRITLASVTPLGGRQYQAAMTEWTGAGFAVPTINDVYTGGYIVEKATGAVVGQISAQAAGLVQFALTADTAPANGQFFVQYDDVHGVRVDIEADVPATGSARLNTRLAQIKYTVQVQTANYDAPSGKTTVQLTGTVPNDTAVGCFVRDQVNDAYYYVAANAGGQLFLLHDRTAVLPAGSYELVIGNPKAGRCVINWEGAGSDEDVSWPDRFTTAVLAANAEHDITVPVPGMSSITSFNAQGRPVKDWAGVITRGAGRANATTGIVHIFNGPVAQAFEICYFVSGKPLPGA